MSELLKRCYRQPKLYIDLPSRGKNYYTKDFFGNGLSANGQLPILAMTAKDEMIMKTPDALLNGEATNKIIKSCCPMIEDPKKLLTPDLEIIVLAIMQASFGKSLGISERCPKCKNIVEKDISIKHLLENQKVEYLEDEYKIEEMLEGGIKAIFYLQPSTNQDYVNSVLAMLEQEKIKMSIERSDLDDDTKIHEISKSFEKMALNNFEFIVNCIEKIVLSEGKDSKEEIIDREIIKNFVSENLEVRIANNIEELCKEINSTGIDKKATIVCDNKIGKDKKICGNKWQTEIEFDFTRFFGISSEF